jgi:hypothetical protein
MGFCVIVLVSLYEEPEKPNNGVEYPFHCHILLFSD